MKILSCLFNIDTACVDICLSDGSVLSLDTVAIENEIVDNMYERSELDYLLYHRPLEYVQMVLESGLEAYLNGNQEHGLEG